MSVERHTLVVHEEVDLGLRLELARVAARSSLEEMAAAAGISVRSYQRTVAGTRPARRGELLAWADLTGQDLEFFGSAPLDNEGAILSDRRPAVKRREAVKA